MRWLPWVVLLAGGLCVATGAVPVGDAAGTLHRVLPLLLFLATVIPLAELTAAARLFDALATRLAILARGSYPALFGLCVLLAAATTAVLNLDTTAVLLTPVMLALARTLELEPLPLAMTTAWLANTASLLLPVSNLTNLLAADRVGLAPAAFAARMWLPELAAVTATGALLWLCYWRTARPLRQTRPRRAQRWRKPDTAVGRPTARVRSYVPPPPYRPPRPALTWTAAAACTLFLAGILLGVPVAAASAATAALLAGAFALRDRDVLRPALVPWALLAFVTGLFLVMQAVSAHGLDTLVRAMIGARPGPAGDVRAAGTGAVLADAINNLPGYLAGESAIGAGQRTRLLALLTGTNIAPVVLPWASLATILWYERCRAYGVRVGWARFVLTGALVAVVSLAAATGALLVTG